MAIPRAPLPSKEHITRAEVITSLRNRVKLNDISYRLRVTVQDVLAIKQDCIKRGLLDKNEQLTLRGVIYVSFITSQIPVPVKQKITEPPKDPATLPPEGESTSTPPCLDARALWRRIGGDEKVFRAELANLVLEKLVKISDGYVIAA